MSWFKKRAKLSFTVVTAPTPREDVTDARGKAFAQEDHLTSCIAAAHRAGDQEHVASLMRRRGQQRDLIKQFTRRVREIDCGVTARDYGWDPKSI